MSPQPPADGTQLRHSYRVASDERMSLAVVRAFRESGLADGLDRLPLDDQLDAEALADLFDRPGPEMELTVTLWDYPVVLTPSRIEIFDPPEA